MKRTQKESKYEERFVALIDILGFKELINRSLTLEIRPEVIRKALDVPEPVGKEEIILGQIGDIAISDHRMNHFSDHVAISTITSEAGLFHLLHHAESITFRLLKEYCLFCRGAITKGLIYHDNSVIFGPALVRVHELEKEAGFPRIILDSEVSAWTCTENGSRMFKRFTYESKGEEHPIMVNVLRRLT